MKVLILGGTAEARELAARLEPAHTVITSLAGRVREPALPVGQVRIGGFGGELGLRTWLVDNHIGAVVDATHPFSTTITENAVSACLKLGLPHLILRRPAWSTEGATSVSCVEEAAQVVSAHGYLRVFLTSGRSTVGAFLFSDAWFLIRAVDPIPADELPERHHLLLSRGPYTVDGETELLQRHEIDALVTKNSGGAMTSAKLEAAAALGVPVVMIERPALPEDARAVETVDEAAAWVSAQGSAAE